jgi:hypothetical protein
MWRYCSAICGVHRLLPEATEPEGFLVSPQVQASVEDLTKSERLAEVTLKAFHEPNPPTTCSGLVDDQVTS